MNNFFKKILLFSEPKSYEQFILKESEGRNTSTSSNNSDKVKPLGIVDKISKLIKHEGEENETGKVSKKIEDNLSNMKSIFNVPANGDIVIREFDVVVKKDTINAFIIFIDGLTDRKIINSDILQPLMVLSNFDIKDNANGVADYIRKHILPHGQIKETKEYSQIINEITFGGCGLFVDGIDSAFTADVKGWEHRAVEKPISEQVIRGPHEGFNEQLRVNTALIRKILKDERLVAETIEVGERSKTPCSMMYIKDIANVDLVDEVRRRLENIKIDYIHNSGEVEQLIEDSTFLPAPQILATERPDRVAMAISEGRVAVVVHGSPFVLVMPVTLQEMIHSAEDTPIRFPYASMLRFVRIIGVAFALLLPGLYIAITNFHQEMIPTSLLLSIESSREKVPFPSIIEILIMELSFELIREAGIRIPSPIGPTLGIVGALILGQAAVAANIVSPILIIIVAVTGIGSFTIPNYSLTLTFRLLRFVYIALGAIMGLLGITVGMYVHLLWAISSKSFGVPMLTPFAPKAFVALQNEIYRGPIWEQESRPDFLQTQKNKMQPRISRKWLRKRGDDNE